MTRTSRFRPWMLPAGIILVGIAELAILVLIARLSSLWVALGLVAVGWIVGFALVVTAGQQSFSRIASLVNTLRGRGEPHSMMSRPAFTLFAALCFFFPGILTDVAGLIFLFTPVQRRTLDAAGLSGKSSRMVFSSRRGGVIEGEIVIDTTEGSRSGARRPAAGDQNDAARFLPSPEDQG